MCDLPNVSEQRKSPNADFGTWNPAAAIRAVRRARWNLELCSSHTCCQESSRLNYLSDAASLIPRFAAVDLIEETLILILDVDPRLCPILGLPRLIRRRM